MAETFFNDEASAFISPPASSLRSSEKWMPPLTDLHQLQNGRTADGKRLLSLACDFIKPEKN